VPEPINNVELLPLYLAGMLPDEVHEQVERALLAAAIEVREPPPLPDDPLLTALRTVQGQLIEEPPALQKCIERVLSTESIGATPTVDPGNTPVHEPRWIPSGVEPKQLGIFRIDRRIGGGGMGVIYEAEDTSLHRRVALKVIRPEIAGGTTRERFLREARAAAKFDHPHVVPVHQAGEENGILYLAMPLLEGETLDALLDRQGALSLEEVVRIGRELVTGLAAAHGAGLLHRDLKPGNIWLQRHPDHSGTVRILDFGLAQFREQNEPQLTRPGGMVGTPGYMSPEQINSEEMDARSDLFAVGCILYEMATGKAAFPGKPVERLAAVGYRNPVPAGTINSRISTGISELIQRLLATNREDRPATAQAVLAELQMPATPGRVGATPTIPTPLPQRERRRLRVPVAVGAVATVIVAGVIGYSWPRAQTEPTQPVVLQTGTTHPVATTYAGWVDATLYIEIDKKAEAYRKVKLSEGGGLPVKAGTHQIHIDAHSTTAAYMYLFWIDTEGKPYPMYPWKPGKWGTRPDSEQPLTHLELPPGSKGYPIAGNSEGMETMVLVIRGTKLTLSDEEVQGWFAEVEPQRPVQTRFTAVWFKNGEVVTAGELRSIDFDAKKINDPVLRTQELLRGRLAKHADFTAAVSFAHEGEVRKDK